MREGSVVFTGVVQARSDSPVTANTIMQVLSTEASSGPLTDGVTTLNVNRAVTAMGMKFLYTVQDLLDVECRKTSTLFCCSLSNRIFPTLSRNLSHIFLPW